MSSLRGIVLALVFALTVTACVVVAYKLAGQLQLDGDKTASPRMPGTKPAPLRVTR
jgi:hypothetical protein